MVSPIFCRQKSWLTTFFSHRPLQSDDLFFSSLAFVSSPLLTFRRRLSSVLSYFSHKKIILVGCHRLDAVTRGDLHPSVTPLLSGSLWEEWTTCHSYLTLRRKVNKKRRIVIGLLQLWALKSFSRVIRWFVPSSAARRQRTWHTVLGMCGIPVSKNDAVIKMAVAYIAGVLSTAVYRLAVLTVSTLFHRVQLIWLRL